MKITAHRGISSIAPENTLAAFKKAAESGCEWIELDVQLCADLVPVIIHDQTVARCTSGSGIVSQMTLAELQSLDAGSWFDPKYCNERIPTLAQTLLLAKETELKVNIELKLYPEDDIELLCEKVSLVINELGINPSQLLFSSFEINALKQMQNKQPEIRRGLLWHKMPDDVFTLLMDVDAYSVHCNYKFLSQLQAQLLKQKGYQIYCFTPNIPEEVALYWEWGVDMMISDSPQVYAAVR